MSLWSNFIMFSLYYTFLFKTQNNYLKNILLFYEKDIYFRDLIIFLILAEIFLLPYNAVCFWYIPCWFLPLLIHLSINTESYVSCLQSEGEVGFLDWLSPLACWLLPHPRFRLLWKLIATVSGTICLCRKTFSSLVVLGLMDVFLLL